MSFGFIFGGFLLSLSLGSMLYGIMIAQSYVYMLSCDKDPRWMKIVAIITAIFETVHTALQLRVLYCYSVLVVENPSSATHADWSINVSLVFDMLIETIVHGYYIHRVLVFSKNKFLAGGTIILVLVGVVGWLYFIIEAFKFPEWTSIENSHFVRVSYIFTLSCTLAVDIILATSLVYYLRINQSSIRRTRNVISWLILYAVNTGLILAASSICAIISYLVVNGSLLFAAFVVFSSKLNANALFGMMNSSHALRNKLTGPVIIGTNDFASRNNANDVALSPVRVQISHQIMEHTDNTETRFEQAIDISSKSAESELNKI